jgi:hypothetical protein
MKSLILKTILGIFIFFSVTGCENQPSKTENTDNPAKQHEIILNDSLQTALLERGGKIAKLAGKSLQKSLQNAIKEGGLEYAISFCNVEAIPITDSVSESASVQIRRLATKYRNPLNLPDVTEQELLQSYVNELEKGQELRPIVRPNADGNPVFYNPILMGALCLNCHGEVGKTVNAELYTIIQDLYPQDKATGFEEGQLRGMWAIIFTELIIK